MKIKSHAKVRWIVVAIFLLAILAGCLDYPKYFNISADWLNKQFDRVKYVDQVNIPHYWNIPLRLGLDLSGGTRLVYRADLSKIDRANYGEAMNGVRDVIEKRVNAFGVAEPIIQVGESSGEWRLTVELAGVTDVSKAIKMIGETPLLEFKELKEPTEEEKAAVKKTAEDVLAKVLKGGDFAKLAKEYSEDPGSKETGGDLGFFKRDALVPEFSRAIFDDLKDGEIAKTLIASQFGYHIIQRLEERTVDGVKEVKSRHILFSLPTNSWINTALSGKNLKKSEVTQNSNTTEVQVALEFDDEGKKLFADITSRNVGKQVAIFLDGNIVTSPVVNEAIRDGRAVITGKFTIIEAKQMSMRLNAGALPVPVELINQQTIGSTLGQESVAKSLTAGFFGFLFVSLFMILYYRLPGFVSVVALAIYVAIVICLFKIFSVTLTLSGIAGFVLSLGMAVDANVLIFERMKEELTEGKPLSLALEEGFKRAWSAIHDGNITTLITCAVLFTFTTSLIKGFALTLAIGVIISMLSAITVTRILLKALLNNKLSQVKFLWLGNK